ncbi:hypothetical protein HNY73_002619 [Argiope bruennichi]|uniref:Secreted protein n=1 Tax=Argiope bruennichi TaxID=94029 RepID=A0A8T0FVD6_ARGBR|nr:hypothetical protein HNY73_002619 [Argiope bruennichi]
MMFSVVLVFCIGGALAAPPTTSQPTVSEAPLEPQVDYPAPVKELGRIGYSSATLTEKIHSSVDSRREKTRTGTEARRREPTMREPMSPIKFNGHSPTL